MTKPVTGIQTFAGVSPPWNLSLLDANFAAFLAAINDVGTYSNYLVDGSGAANQITVTTAGSVTFALVAGALLQVKVANTTTSGTVAMTVNGGPSTPLVGFGGIALIAGQLVAGGVYLLLYDGTNWQTINALTSGRTAAEISLSITPVNYVYLPGNVLRYGTNTTPGNTDMTTAIQNCLNVCGLSGDTCFIPAGTYKITADINVSLGVAFLSNPAPLAINIQGAGREQTVIQFSGAGFTNGFYWNAGTPYKLAGSIRDIRLDGGLTASQSLTFYGCDMPLVERCIVRNFTGRGVYFNTCIQPQLNRSYISNCGSASFGQVEFDNCTTICWDTSYISGSNAGCIGGVLVDRTTAGSIRGGAIESSGSPIVLGSKTEATKGVTSLFIGFIDLENPGTNNPYIVTGGGLSGSAHVSSLTLDTVTTGAGATAQLNYAVQFANTFGVEERNCYWSQAGTPLATHNLVGLTNNYINIRASGANFGWTWPWVIRNGVQVLAAGPQVDFFSNNFGNAGLRNATAQLNGATPDVRISTTQGGYYGLFEVNNGSPTTITTLTGGEQGMEIIIFAANGNTTVTAGTGAGQFNTRSGSNFNLVSGRFYRYICNSALCWVEFVTS